MYSEFSWMQNVWKINSNFLDSFPTPGQAKWQTPMSRYMARSQRPPPLWHRGNNYGIWSVPWREAARPRACLCSHSHKVCFCLVFHLREERHNDFHYHSLTPSQSFYSHRRNPRGESTVCDKEICLFSVLQTLDRIQGPPFPRRPALMFMICISLPYTEPCEKLSEPAEWWELKVASKKSPFSSSFCTESALPEI